MASNNIPGFTRSDEYETQLYGFSSHDLFLHLKDFLLHEMKTSTELLKNFLLELQKSEDHKAAAEKSIEAFIAKSEEMTTVALANLEENVSSTFSIPPYVLLPSDNVQRKSYTQEDELKEKEKVSKLKSRYRRAEFLKQVLQEELAMASELEGSIEMGRKVMSEIKELKDSSENYEQDSKNFHKIVQDLLGVEVKEASLKLSNGPSWAESEDIMDEHIFNEYFSGQ
ncbi:uncharacterized protein LOC113214961 [Frankliniella occidentalis]|uniref:Uncharacterized protein LOC113214961 n=1 Tax=Frankliniella occidentalis TaxID=133901 RepID=A0A6J1TBY2_FRAOC|nr:uncharacterized protein LOC113214961 [Frankliniella occidentalis]